LGQLNGDSSGALNKANPDISSQAMQ